MTHAPSIYELDIERVIQYARKSDGDLWRAAIALVRVQKYGNLLDVKQYIAEETGKDISAVENWLHAGELFMELLGEGYPVWCLRRGLTISHFWAAWELRQKWGMTNKRVVKYLEDFVAYRKQGMKQGTSSQALRRDVDAEHDKGGSSPTWSYFAPKLRVWCEKLLVTEQVPFTIQIHVQAILKELS